MGYLIMQSEDGDYFKAVRHPLKTPAYADVIKHLSKDWEEVATPMDKMPKNGQIIIVYTSDDIHGVGRSGSAVFSYAVADKKY